MGLCLAAGLCRRALQLLQHATLSRRHPKTDAPRRVRFTHCASLTASKTFETVSRAALRVGGSGAVVLVSLHQRISAIVMAGRTLSAEGDSNMLTRSWRSESFLSGVLRDSILTFHAAMSIAHAKFRPVKIHVTRDDPLIDTSVLASLQPSNGVQFHHWTSLSKLKAPRIINAQHQINGQEEGHIWQHFALCRKLRSNSNDTVDRMRCSGDVRLRNSVGFDELRRYIHPYESPPIAVPSKLRAGNGRDIYTETEWRPARYLLCLQHSESMSRTTSNCRGRYSGCWQSITCLPPRIRARSSLD